MCADVAERVVGDELVIYNARFDLGFSPDRLRVASAHWLSFETRTVNGTDAIAEYGAPNVDGGAAHTAYSMFKHIESGRKLGESRST